MSLSKCEKLNARMIENAVPSAILRGIATAGAVASPETSVAITNPWHRFLWHDPRAQFSQAVGLTRIQRMSARFLAMADIRSSASEMSAVDHPEPLTVLPVRFPALGKGF